MSAFDPLLAAARAVRKNAYAPYSHYTVGAAVRGDNGKIYAGANVENASYGLSICAERTAIAAAVLDGVRKLEALVVITSSTPPAAPCGMCRQTLVEFAQDMPILLVNEAGDQIETKLSELLPHAFRPENLLKR
jgi:cytidine deaminase